ncbi:MAG: methyl-coenzyme M reductase subunit gamma, partial [Methanosphaera sp.]|nr:methyl-coenzyme M reductase subunit gamma [Methanosphaera sp.]
MAYDVQFYPGESKIAENRRKHLNPDYELEILRS